MLSEMALVTTDSDASSFTITLGRGMIILVVDNVGTGTGLELALVCNPFWDTGLLIHCVGYSYMGGLIFRRFTRLKILVSFGWFGLSVPSVPSTLTTTSGGGMLSVMDWVTTDSDASPFTTTSGGDVGTGTWLELASEICDWCNFKMGHLVRIMARKKDFFQILRREATGSVSKHWTRRKTIKNI
jgi:hypothetical protein